MSLLLIYAQKVSSGTTIVSGAFSASGSVSATFVGQSQASTVFSAAGQGAAAWVGNSVTTATYSAAGVGAFNLTGQSIAQTLYSASATETAQFVGSTASGATVITGDFSAAASMSASPVGASIAKTDLQAQAQMAASPEGASIAKTDLQAQGQMAAQFVGQQAGAAVIISAEFSASASINSKFVGSIPSAYDWAAVSGDNPWRANARQREAQLRIEDEEILAIMREVMPHISHRRVGLRPFSRSSSRGRSPSPR